MGAAWEFGDGSRSGVTEVGVDFGFQWVRTNAKHSVFGLQNHVHPFGNVVGDKRGHADAEIDVVAVAQLKRDTAGDAFAFLLFRPNHSLILDKWGEACFAPTNSLLLSPPMALTSLFLFL